MSFSEGDKIIIDHIRHIEPAQLKARMFGLIEENNDSIISEVYLYISHFHMKHAIDVRKQVDKMKFLLILISCS